MKIAVISDIHGNLPALEAVLRDAEKRGIAEFIFAGDYCLSGPYPDACISAVRPDADILLVFQEYRAGKPALSD